MNLTNQNNMIEEPWRYGKTMPKENWTIYTSKQAIIWLIEEKLAYGRKDILTKLCRKDFTDNNLEYVLDLACGNSIFKAVSMVYPLQYSIEDFPNDRNSKHILNEGKVKIQDVLKEKKIISISEIKKKLKDEVIINSGLEKEYVELFNGDLFQLVNTLYPNQIEEWELKFYKVKWDDEKVIRATKWLIKKLKFDEDMVKKDLSYELFKKNNLEGMLIEKCNGSIFEAIDLAFPNTYKEWELKHHVFKWNKELGTKASEWLFIDKLKLTKDSEELKSIPKDIFKKYNLQSMFRNIFKLNMYSVINSVFPGELEEWELENHKVTWTTEKIKKAIIWIVEVKYKWSEDEVRQFINRNIFYKNGLRAVLKHYNYDIEAALNSVYPSTYKIWQLKSQYKFDYWDKDTIATATRWVIQEKLKWNEETVIKRLDKDILMRHGLGSPLKKFKGDIYALLDNAYPGKYQIWEVKKKLPKGHWDDKNSSEAIKWVIEKRLNWDEKKARECFNVDTISNKNFKRMLEKKYDNNIEKALDSVFSKN